MKRIALITGFIMMGLVNAWALEGSWRGSLNVGHDTLPLVMNFTDTGGVSKCTMDSPLQNAFGIPAEVTFESADSIAVSVGIIGASFCGHVYSEKIIGVFSQRDMKFPLTLTPDISSEERRPQTPRPPFPYQEIDTAFCSTDGVKLCGTFVLPGNYERGTTPVCVFVSGSGPQNRDEEIFEHKPFAVIADYLGARGIASFRYDDRGTASSQGDYASATIATFKDDAESALAFARNFCGGKVGIIGHSEGGTIALLLASEGKTDFVVSLAGMAVSGKETVLAQNKRALEGVGFDEVTLEGSMKLLDAVFDEVIRQTADGVTSSVDVQNLAAMLGVSVPQTLLKSIGDSLSKRNSYLASMLATDARKGMGAITCPVLAVNGSLDTQVSAWENLEAIHTGVKQAVTIEYPGLNHLLQHAKTGEVREYVEIKETISPEVLGQIVSFLQML